MGPATEELTMARSATMEIFENNILVAGDVVDTGDWNRSD